MLGRLGLWENFLFCMTFRHLSDTDVVLVRLFTLRPAIRTAQSETAVAVLHKARVHNGSRDGFTMCVN
jgi:hypothetical protein